MKRFGIIFGLIVTITSTIAMVVLLILAIMHNNKYIPFDSIVYVESINNESVKDGMGFVYEIENNKNYIVTNYHVVESSNSIYVENTNREKISAKLLWYDIYTDIAVLQINDELNLKEIIINDSKVKKGEELYYYNIQDKNLKKGKVLSLENEIYVNANYGSSYYLANSIIADIDNGNSGSPLFNLDNEFVGMICLKEEEKNNAYYLDYNYINNIVSKLKNHELFRPNLGATFINTTNVDILNQYGIYPGELVGVVMIDLKEGYPLQLSGLMHGDIITKINETPVNNVNELQKIIYSFNTNDVVSIEFVRYGMYSRVDVVLK